MKSIIIAFSRLIIIINFILQIFIKKLPCKSVQSVEHYSVQANAAHYLRSLIRQFFVDKFFQR
jgi:hypothetical protein